MSEDMEGVEWFGKPHQGITTPHPTSCECCTQKVAKADEMKQLADRLWAEATQKLAAMMGKSAEDAQALMKKMVRAFEPPNDGKSQSAALLGVAEIAGLKSAVRAARAEEEHRHREEMDWQYRKPPVPKQEHLYMLRPVWPYDPPIMVHPNHPLAPAPLDQRQRLLLDIEVACHEAWLVAKGVQKVI